MTHTSRSVKRRVKRRASKSVKRKLRPMSKKRMNLRKMRGGKDPNDFFRIYGVLIGEKLIGILLYNNVTKHFHLFIESGVEPENAIKLIKGLCGVQIEDPVPFESGEKKWNFEYYFSFDGDLYSVQIRNKGAAASNITETKIQAKPQLLTSMELDPANGEQIVEIGEVECTLHEVFKSNGELYKQPLKKTITSSKDARIIGACEIAKTARDAVKAKLEEDKREKEKTDMKKKMDEAENNPACTILSERILKCSEAHGKILEEIKTWVEDSRGNEDTWKKTKTPKEMAAINKTFSELLELRTELPRSPCFDFFLHWTGIIRPRAMNNILRTTFTNITAMFSHFEQLERDERARVEYTYNT